MLDSTHTTGNIVLKIHDNQGILHNVSTEGMIQVLEGGDEWEAVGFSSSKIDGTDKFTTGLQNCTSVIGFGEEEINGVGISFLTHQAPHIFLKSPDEFLKRLKALLLSLKQQSKNGSTNIKIVGGNSNYSFSEYLKQITLIGNTIYETLGYYPEVVGPTLSKREIEEFTNNRVGAKDVIVHTEQKRIELFKSSLATKSNVLFTSDKVHDIVATLTAEDYQKLW